ncbi:MAG: hypothetical protein PVF82_07550 [Gammaproteobacteria bacterium]
MDSTGKAQSDELIPPRQTEGYFKVLSTSYTDQILAEDKAGWR